MDIVQNKICCVIAHGKSVDELEQRIEEFKNLDVVWCGMNYFTPTEAILAKINKQFQVVFDCSTVKNNREYEVQARLPRLQEYLDRPVNNLYITLKTGKDNLYALREIVAPSFNKTYQEKILYAEDCGFDTNQFCVSLHLYLATLIKLGGRRIVLFGADGGGVDGNNVSSYYRWDLVKKDKELADNVSYNMVGDTNNINSTFAPIMTQIFGSVPEIINCSPISSYTVFKKVNYDELLQLFREQKL